MKSDKEILEAIRNGNDNAALSALYKLVLPGVIKYINKSGGNKSEACDIFQDVIMAFYKSAVNNTFNEEKYKIQGFLFTMCKNYWINRVQRSKKSVTLVEEEQELNFIEERTILDDMVLKERDQLLNKLFSFLDKKCIDILTLSVYNKNTMKEIATKLGMSSDNVAKINNYRCKQKLIDLASVNPVLKSMLQ